MTWEPAAQWPWGWAPCRWGEPRSCWRCQWRDAAEQATTFKLVALRSEAAQAGDLEQVGLCDLALRGDAEAQVLCEAALAQAQAQDDEADGDIPW